MGAFMDASWCATAIATVLLTFHRLVWTAFPFRAKRIISSNISKMLLSILWIFFGVMLAFNLTPYSSLRFRKDWISWYYARDLPYSIICLRLHISCTYASAIVTTLVYIVVFAILFHGKSQIRKSREMRMTLMVFSFCGYQLFCFIIWEFILPALEYDEYLSSLSLIMWVIWSGASAVLYMTFSVSFRRDLKSMIQSTGFCGNDSRMTTMVASHISTHIVTKNRTKTTQ
ncbi:hypothetical protein NECAME_11549 [Necator americanus]|uniref:G-protein coupled receptors family 1 profile domain-containing protein n=1 Tax=Necator americanus TaxID=51031 RepID=W2T3N5_NECAM|nr:hypothetical protein NECAME_11549 [Necator americanus]ETN76625.1 hypothetical protein NECAME_11549 [Necator americanus]